MRRRPKSLASIEYAPGPDIMRDAAVNSCSTKERMAAPMPLSAKRPERMLKEQTIGVKAPQSTSKARQKAPSPAGVGSPKSRSKLFGHTSGVRHTTRTAFPTL